MLQEQYAASFDNRRNQKKIFRLIAMKRKECKTAMEKEYHKIMDQAVLSTILIPLFVLAVHYVLSFIIVLVPTVIMAVVYGDGSYEIIHILGRIIEPVILLIVTELIYTRIWFKGEFEGTLKGNIRYGFLLMIPAFLFEILIIILLFIYCKFSNTGGVDILSVLSASLAPVIVEATMYRSFILPNCMRITHIYNGMLGAVAASTLILDLVRLTSGSGFRDLFDTSCMVIFFAAVYLRCGSNLPAIIYHACHNIIVELNKSLFTAGMAAKTVPVSGKTLSVIISVIPNLTFLIIGICLLRRKNYEKIRHLWDMKWHM